MYNGLYHDTGRSDYEYRVGQWSDPSSGGDGSVTGGNFSWNTGIDYRSQLHHSDSADVVEAMYALAGLDLNADLDRLNAAPRIAADPGATTKMMKLDPVFSGNVGRAFVVTMKTLADPIGYPNQDQGYRQAFVDAGTTGATRQLFVERQGHCAFTAAEMIVGIQLLLERIHHHSHCCWSATDSGTLNARASALGPQYNQLVQNDNPRVTTPEPPRFLDYSVPVFLRNFNTHSFNPYP